MGREYFVTGSNIEMDKDSIVLRGRRSQSGPEIEIRLPAETILSLAMHVRRAKAGHQAMNTPQRSADWKHVHALPVRTAQVHATTDQTMGTCLLVLDPGTDVELQLSLPNIEFVRQLAAELQNAADQSPQGTRPN